MLARRILSKFCTTTNYYKLFNIPTNFTEQELKTAYLELVKKYHPDLSKEPNAADMFRTIQEGYAILSDSSTRIKYQSTQTEASPDLDQSEIMETMRDKYYRNFSRKDPLNDEYNFSYKLFKQHYEQMEQPKAEYQKYEGQNESYYARKDEQGEKPWRQVAAGSAALLIVLAAYYYTNNWVIRKMVILVYHSGCRLILLLRWRDPCEADRRFL